MRARVNTHESFARFGVTNNTPNTCVVGKQVWCLDIQRNGLLATFPGPVGSLKQTHVIALKQLASSGQAHSIA